MKEKMIKIVIFLCSMIGLLQAAETEEVGYERTKKAKEQAATNITSDVSDLLTLEMQLDAHAIELQQAYYAQDICRISIATLQDQQILFFKLDAKLKPINIDDISSAFPTLLVGDDNVPSILQKMLQRNDEHNAVLRTKSYAAKPEFVIKWGYSSSDSDLPRLTVQVHPFSFSPLIFAELERTVAQGHGFNDYRGDVQSKKFETEKALAHNKETFATLETIIINRTIRIAALKEQKSRILLEIRAALAHFD